MIVAQLVENYQSLSKIVADQVEKIIKLKTNVNLALPTGQTPIGMYKELTSRSLNWSHVQTFNLDEYCDVDYSDSYKKYMWDHFHSLTNVKNKFFPSIDYDKIIEYHGGLDLTILGLGHNGHIAFNEPGSSINSKTRIVKLHDITKQNNKCQYEHAITMGIDTILNSKEIVLIVNGYSKFHILKQALWGEITENCPASYLQTHKNLSVYYCA